ncbi:unnamed protein product [Arabidopsis halleri]
MERLDKSLKEAIQSHPIRKCKDKERNLTISRNKDHEIKHDTLTEMPSRRHRNNKKHKSENKIWVGKSKKQWHYYRQSSPSIKQIRHHPHRRNHEPHISETLDRFHREHNLTDRNNQQETPNEGHKNSKSENTTERRSTKEEKRNEN